MPVLNLQLDEIRKARAALGEQRDAQRAQSAALAAARGELEAMLRSGVQGQELDAKQRQVQSLQAAVREAAKSARLGIGGLRELSDRLMVGMGDPALLVQALSTQQPVMLMPVAVQTRYAKDMSSLMIRIYPDAIHTFAHEPGLTPPEIEAGKAYWSARFAVPADSDSPWAEIARRYRPARAAWIVRRTTPTNLADLGQAPNGTLAAPAFDDAAIPQADPKAQPVYAVAMPDRFVAIGYRGETEIFRQWGGAVPELLPMSPALDPEQVDAPPPDKPEDYDAFGADLAWMIDYASAVKLGMGITIDATMMKNGGTLPGGVDRLIVLGVDWTQTPASAAELVGELFDNHQNGAGLKFVPQGTPTNNTSGARAGFAANGGDLLNALEPQAAAQRAGEVAAQLASAGARLQNLLGLPQAVFDAGLIPGAELQEGATAGHMINALWPATLGYTLRNFWNPIDSATTLISDDSLEQLRAWATRYLRPGGPLSALRIGKQPYGILPVSARGMLPLANSPLERELSQAIDWFRVQWDRVLSKVPTLRNPSPESLHQVLAMQPWPVAKRFWQVAGPVTAGNDPPSGFIYDWQAQFAAVLLESLLSGKPWWAKVPFIAGCGTRPKPYPLDAVPWVQRDQQNPTRELDGDVPLQDNFIAKLLELLSQPRTQVRSDIVAMQNAPSLLQALLAFAADEEFLHAAHRLLRLHIQKIPTVSAETKLRVQRLRSAELIGVDNLSLVGDQFSLNHPRAVLGLKLADTTGDMTVEQSIGSLLSKVVLNYPEHMSNIASFSQSLEALQSRTAGELSLALRTTLDLYSTRLDAWITSFATRRLDDLRQASPGGLHIGAWGYVENLRPDGAPRGVPMPDSLGYVHAPSLQQATTAAILRSGHVANRMAAGGAFDIDLRSRRVKRARRLLEGLANGQQMAALVGYRFERALRDGNLSPFILDFRTAFPLRPTGETYNDQPKEQIAARDVTDGARLIDAYRQAGSVPAMLAAIAAAPPQLVLTADEQAKLKLILDDLLDQMDAVADLLMAESVFQMAGGNLDAAAAAMQSLDKQERPPETRVADTPHGTRGYTQRVVIALKATSAPDWPANDLAARLEPRLNAWLGKLLGQPASYVFGARVLRRHEVAADGKTTVQWSDDNDPLLSISLADLGLSPLSLVLQSEAKQAGSAGSGQSGVQEHLAAALGVRARNQFGDAASQMALVLQADAPPDAPAGSLGLVAFESYAWLLRRLLEKVRPLRRMDLVRAEDGIETEALLADGDFAGLDLADLKARLKIADDTAQAVLDQLKAALPDDAVDLDAVAAMDPSDPASIAMFNAIRTALDAAYALGWRSAQASGAVAQAGAAAEGAQVQPGDTLLLAVARGRALWHEVSGRRDAAPAPTDFEKDGVTPVGKARQAQLALARMAAIVGKEFPLLPCFTLGAYATDAAATLGDRDMLLAKAALNNDDTVIDGWLPKLGCVREATGLLADVLTAAEGIGSRTGYSGASGDFKLMQFPRDATAHWAALPPAEKQELRGTVAVVAHAPGALEGIAPDEAIAGLFVDEWMETLPDTEETTGLGFHFDAPGARPPQSILLAVPADPAADAWTLDALLATVNETMALARLRAVRPQDLESLGLILPGIFLSNNFKRDVPTVDFSAMVSSNLQVMRAVAGLSASQQGVLAVGSNLVSG